MIVIHRQENIKILDYSRYVSNPQSIQLLQEFKNTYDGPIVPLIGESFYKDALMIVLEQNNRYFGVIFEKIFQSIG